MTGKADIVDPMEPEGMWENYQREKNRIFAARLNALREKEKNPQQTIRLIERFGFRHIRKFLSAKRDDEFYGQSRDFIGSTRTDKYALLRYAEHYIPKNEKIHRFAAIAMLGCMLASVPLSTSEIGWFFALTGILSTGLAAGNYAFVVNQRYNQARILQLIEQLHARDKKRQAKLSSEHKSQSDEEESSSQK